WQDCSEKTRMLVPLGVASLYIRSLHESSHARKEEVEEAVRQARQVVEGVSSAFREMLSSATWMDQVTQEAALSKLDHMQHLVAYPHLLLDDHLLQEYHLGLPNVSASDHFSNIASMMAWHSRRSLVHLRAPTSTHKWPRGPLETNAFYSSLHNTIVIPVAVLQAPVFHRGAFTSIPGLEWFTEALVDQQDPGAVH
ncbi:hypothetical protein OTU49_001497, partial [Cherax quadricarinatus]